MSLFDKKNDQLYWTPIIFFCIHGLLFSNVMQHFFFLDGSTFPTWIVFISSNQDTYVRQSTMKFSLDIWNTPRLWATQLLTSGLVHRVKETITSSTVTRLSRKYRSQSGCKNGTERCWTRPSLIVLL